jgi:zinc protease
VPDGGIDRGLEAVLTEAERVARHGFTASELEREKADLLRYYETAFAEREKTNSALYADEYVRNFLQNESIPGIAAEYTLVKELLPGIALTELNALAREWMPDSNRVIVATAPEKAGVTIPSKEELLGIFAAVEKKEIAPYADDVADAPLVARPPTPGTVVSERKIASLDVTEWTLSWGSPGASRSSGGCP